MRASVELLNQALIVRILDGHGNPARVLIGGNDGILVTIGPNGRITVLPPEGPGDPELLAACKSLLSGLVQIDRYYSQCVAIEEQMTAIGTEISNAEKGIEQLPPGVTIST